MKDKLIGNSEKIIQWLFKQDKEKQFEIKLFKEKRTLTQNNYYWQLVTKLADVLRTSKDELHEQLIRRYSSRDFVPLPANAKPSDYFDYYDYSSTVRLGTNLYKSYLVYKPSRKMNKAEFGVLLDGLISECEECDIETLTPEQLANLKYIENVK